MQNYKTIEFPEVPDMSKESLELRVKSLDVVFKAETLAYLSAIFFDGLSLTGAEVFSFDSLHISDDVDFSTVLSFKWGGSF